MSSDVATKTNIARTFKVLNASDVSNGKLPTRIEILKAGTWPASSNKGQLEITVSDLQEMKTNFDNGIGMAGGAGFGLPVDFMHEDWNKAAAWIKGLQVDGDTLYADPVEWSTAGEESVLGGEFKCISPSFYPACLGMWTDPEDANITARNVLVGAGLTNIPFFKDLKPIMASRSSESESGETIYIKASEKEKPMKLEDVVAKDVDALTEEEKTFLTEQKEHLTADQRKKFGFEEPAEKEVKADKKTEEPKVEDKKVEASTQKVEGMVQVEASRLASLEASAKEYQHDKASQYVDSLIERGAIKADQKDTIVSQLVEASEEQRSSLKAIYDNLPDHPVTAAAKGSEASKEVSVFEQVQTKAKEKVTAAAKEGRTLNISNAISEVLSENADLKEQYNKEGKV